MEWRVEVGQGGMKVTTYGAAANGGRRRVHRAVKFLKDQDLNQNLERFFEERQAEKPRLAGG